MILVTGATGFVGTALCADLTARGIASRPASRLPTSGFHPVGAIDARTDWTEALAGIDCVVHLAARVHVMDDTAADPLAAFRAANVDATLNLAHQAAAAGARRFIFVSSIKVNGEETAPGRPFTAADVPEPRDPYGLSKWEAEQALFDLGRQTGMDIVVIRPPLIYGPGVKANFASLMRLARRGLPLPFGLISNKRSLLFVGNLTDFIILCVAHPDAANRTFRQRRRGPFHRAVDRRHFWRNGSQDLAAARATPPHRSGCGNAGQGFGGETAAGFAASRYRRDPTHYRLDATVFKRTGSGADGAGLPRLEAPDGMAHKAWIVELERRFDIDHDAAGFQQV